MHITLIAAASENNVIGNQGKIPWRIPADMKRLKERTMGHPLIMGRKTHEAMGKALPGRTNIVITRQNVKYPGCVVVSSLQEGLKVALDEGTDEAFIFGGGEIYAQAMPLADKIDLTRVHANVEGDAYFPEIDPEHWKEVSKDDHDADINNQYPYSFITYERR